MARQLRFAPADIPAHVWARGNNRQDIFFSDLDRLRYRDLLVRHCHEHNVRILAYCFMSNHIHLILQPTTDSGLSLTMHRLQAEYALTMHFLHHRSGHFWQGRFRCAPMDDSYLWTVFRYVELNPVRARFVSSPEQWPWSSASAHVGDTEWPEWLDRSNFQTRHDTASWRTVLSVPPDLELQAAIRQSTRRNRPLALPDQVRTWEQQYDLPLTHPPMGRPRKKPLAAATAAE